ncbi:MAG: hypothetical protein QF491_09380, partial [Alphaproteobacteria bacterium]|nr:hypothetical protein [Alphaproteobacteria bacterium]
MSEPDQDLSVEIRVHQSMLVVRGMPVLILGNIAAVGLVVLLDWARFVSSHAWFAAVVLLVLLLPLAVNYVRLRDKPRPDRASRRRIRRIEIHSLLMGLAVAAMAALITPSLGAIEQVLIGTLALFLCYGAVAVVGSIPVAALSYILPIWLAAYLVLMFSGPIGQVTLGVVFWVALIAYLQNCRQNWLDFRSNVALSLERARILREKLEAEA